MSTRIVCKITLSAQLQVDSVIFIDDPFELGCCENYLVAQVFLVREFSYIQLGFLPIRQMYVKQTDRSRYYGLDYTKSGYP